MVNLFIRQSFTEAGEVEKHITQEVLNCLCSMQYEFHEPLSFLTGTEALTSENFKADFTQKTGIAFTAQSFRNYRLQLLNKAHAFINIRTSLSESSAFEIAYNIFKGNQVPIFFAIWNQAQIKTTLLQDLSDLCDVEYYHFDHASDLRLPFKQFIERIVAETPVLYYVNS